MTGVILQSKKLSRVFSNNTVQKHQVFGAQLSLVFPCGSEVQVSACNAGDLGLIPKSEDPLEKEIATHSSTLASEEPGRSQSMGSQSLIRLSNFSSSL